MRLIDSSSSDGRLEIFHNGQWGTVCAPWPSWFNKSSATVVCRMLGFSSGTIYGLIYGEFTLDNGPIWLSYPHCKGNELSIFDCPMHHDMPIGSPWSGCNHRYDVGVSCQGQFGSGYIQTDGQTGRNPCKISITLSLNIVIFSIFFSQPTSPKARGHILPS